MRRHKWRHCRGVKSNTRSNTELTKVQVKIQRAVLKYRAARDAMIHLDKGGAGRQGWEGEFRDLRDEHVRGLAEGAAGQSEGKRTISWIWLSEGATGGDDDDPNLHDGEPFFSLRFQME